MDSLIRVASLSHKLTLGDPKKTAGAMLSLLESAKPYSPDVYLFPAYALTGSQLGSLGFHGTIVSCCEACVRMIQAETKKLDAYVVFGGLLFQDNRPQNAIYVLHKGEIKAILSEQNTDFVFAVRDIKFHVLSRSAQELPQWTGRLAELGCDLTLLPIASPATAGSGEKLLKTLEFVSEGAACGLACADGCAGDTSFPALHRAAAGNVECGKALGFKQSLSGGIFTVTDFDTDIIRAQKARRGLPLYKDDFCDLITPAPHSDLLRIVGKEPYLPSGEEERRAYLLDLFQLQSASLAARLENIHTQRVVIGVSGGLDSTLALLVCANAFTALGLPKANITAITMQGFGTSDTTYENALILMKTLGCTVREIPIRDSVLQHFADIGHDPAVHDVVYENAQARERTQILLDVANGLGAIVIGTGDLSEEALGFCTFAGDQIANFNVNTCVTKTMIRAMAAQLAETTRFAACRTVLLDILNTPVSPELLPPSENGSIRQKTEDILGSYSLHDFFLYYFVLCRFAPSKLYTYAKKAFADEFAPAYIKEKLSLFLRRFCTSQFKRSCAPDSAVLTELNLANAEFSMPSDIGPGMFLEELEQAD